MKFQSKYSIGHRVCFTYEGKPSTGIVHSIEFCKAVPTGIYHVNVTFDGYERTYHFYENDLGEFHGQ